MMWPGKPRKQPLLMLLSPFEQVHTINIRVTLEICRKAVQIASTVVIDE